MKVYIVTGHTDIHNCGFEDGNPMAFSTLDAAIAQVKKEYGFWRQNFKDDLKPEDIASELAYDVPPCDCGACFTTSRDDTFDWTITEVEVDQHIDPFSDGIVVLK